MEEELMSIDDSRINILQGSLSPGSCITSVSQQRSVISMNHRSLNPVPTQPLSYDWNWVAGEEVKVRYVRPVFFRGRGGLKFRGKRMPFFNAGPGRRFGNRPFGRQIVDEGDRIPVHQRLGWLTPARRAAMRSVKTAGQTLNRLSRQNVQQRGGISLSQRREFRRNDIVDSRQVARFQQLREMRRMCDGDDDKSVITVLIKNDLATRRAIQPYRVRQGGRGRGRPFNRPQYGPRLSLQNVAHHSGLTGSPAARNQSLQSFRSRASYNNNNNIVYKNQRKLMNRKIRAQQQLPPTPHAASLQSVQRQLNSGSFLIPTAPHSVTLDKNLQEEIVWLQQQRSVQRVVPKQEDYEYRAPIYTTTTSISDRFGMVRTCSSVT